MFYDFEVVIPAGRTKAAPVEVEAKLTYGVIHRVEIEFRKGCAGKAHLAIYHFEHQAWPTNPEESFTSDGYTIAFNESYEFTSAPYTLYLRGWSPTAKFSHTLRVRIGVLSFEALGLKPKKPGVLERLTKAMMGD